MEIIFTNILRHMTANRLDKWDNEQWTGHVTHQMQSGSTLNSQSSDVNSSIVSECSMAKEYQNVADV
jgi:hypothetical protein